MRAVGRYGGRAVKSALAGALFVTALPPYRPTAHRPTTQADAAPILDAAVTKFQRVTTLRADFTQTVHDEMIGTSAVSRGEFLEQRPNKYVLRFREPAGDIILVDGTWFWLYTPSSTPGQVVKSAVSTGANDTPDIVAQFLMHPRERFDITYLRAEPIGGRPADALTFLPRKANGPYQRVVVWVDRADSLPHQIEITEASGAVRRFTLEHIRVNVAIPPSTFVFHPPANVRIVDASSNE